MGANIIIEASGVWGTFLREKESLRTYEKLIAENREYGAEIYLAEEHGRPNIIAYLDNNAIDEELCISEADCKDTVHKFYDEYLTEKVLQKGAGENDDEYLELMETMSEIDDREDELDSAVIDFINTALDIGGHYLEEFTEDSDEVYKDVKEHFLEYLARKWGLPVYRPMYLEDENGDDFYEEYPYDCMVFEDEDNPLYK